jgi:hypothetical protein
MASLLVKEGSLDFYGTSPAKGGGGGGCRKADEGVIPHTLTKEAFYAL